MEMGKRNYWEDNGEAVKYEKYNGNEELPLSAGCTDQLNFATSVSGDEGEGSGYMKKGKVSRQDPMSHRIIEKRRRDRMNNCLADLSRLVPTQYMKKGRGRVEKTEIIEMAIKHIKFLQDRAYGLYNANNRDEAAEQRVANESAEHYRAGFQEALSESLRFLVQVHEYTPEDELYLEMAAQLHRHCEHLTKGDVPPRLKSCSNAGSGNATETNSSSGSYTREDYQKPTVIARKEAPEKPAYREPYQASSTVETAFTLECVDRADAARDAYFAAGGTSSDDRSPLLEGRRKREHDPCSVREADNSDYLHSYKFKNSIERRFSKSQEPEVHDMSMQSSTHPSKVFTHKRRRAGNPAAHAHESTSTSTTTSNSSGSAEEARDTSLQDTSSDSHQDNYDKTATQPQHTVPVFALNSCGKYYVPLTVHPSCLSRSHGSCEDALTSLPNRLTTPLHPVTIHVNYQPCFNYRVKQEPAQRGWAA